MPDDTKLREVAVVVGVTISGVVTLHLDSADECWSERDIERMARDQLVHQTEYGGADTTINLLEVRGRL